MSLSREESHPLARPYVGHTEVSGEVLWREERFGPDRETHGNTTRIGEKPLCYGLHRESDFWGSQHEQVIEPTPEVTKESVQSRPASKNDWLVCGWFISLSFPSIH